MSSVITSVNDGVGTLTFNRPERRNALSLELMDEMSDALDAWKSDDAVAAVVVTGGEDFFCAGLDLDLQSGFTEQTRDVYSACAIRVYGTLLDYPKPTIAAVGGPAYGGGIEIAVFCDIRIGADNGRYAWSQIKFGLTPYFAPLARVVGVSQAKLLAFTGDPVDPVEALRIGLLDRLVPAGTVVKAATEIARSIAETTTYSAMVNKEMALRSITMDPISALSFETSIYREVIRRPEINERIQAAYARIGSRAKGTT